MTISIHKMITDNKFSVSLVCVISLFVLMASGSTATTIVYAIRLLQTTLDQPHHQLPLQGPLHQDLVHQVVAVVEVAQHIAIGQDTHLVLV
ncbi:MAG TPA: hypothetical protein VEP90_23830 [Methylomirabilota bacterium]|nr:hypothetical protein [Methylomirabilota bacterium]